MLLVITTLGLSCDRNDLSGGRGPPGAPPDEGEPDVLECPPPPAPTALRAKINEVQFENLTTLEDETGGFPPWIEIYNPTDAAIDLGGVPLSDDILAAGKWPIPCVPEAILPPHGFLVMFADGRAAELEGFHTSFRLPAAGRVTLFFNRGSDVVNIDAGLLDPDRSAGRFPDGAPSVEVLSAPTPGAPNAPSLEPKVPMDAEFLRADADENGTVNVQDMWLIVQVLFDLRAGPACRDRLDANDDGQIDLSDTSYIADALFRGGPNFPPPFPNHGPDPTPDELDCPKP